MEDLAMAKLAVSMIAQMGMSVIDQIGIRDLIKEQTEKYAMLMTSLRDVLGVKPECVRLVEAMFVLAFLEDVYGDSDPKEECLLCAEREGCKDKSSQVVRIWQGVVAVLEESSHNIDDYELEKNILAYRALVCENMEENSHIVIACSQIDGHLDKLIQVKSAFSDRHMN